MSFKTRFSSCFSGISATTVKTILEGMNFWATNWRSISGVIFFTEARVPRMGRSSVFRHQADSLIFFCFSRMLS